MEKHVLSSTKINLFLEVVAKRSDGYHDLETVFQELDLADDIYLTVGEGSGIRIESDSAEVPLDSSNLAYRAAQEFFEAAGIQASLKVKIVKKIPVAAGLGGGSSNAAAVLRALLEWFQPSLTPDKIHQVARSLGADVPFFLRGKTALGRGIGDILEPIERRLDFYVVLINPRFKLLTPEVYRALSSDLTRVHTGINLVKAALESGSLGDLASGLFNRLEEVALNRFEELMGFKKWVQSLGFKGVLLSGSGPTMYCLVQGKAEAKDLRGRIDDWCRGLWWTAVARAV